jgi:peroxiredoxin
VTYPWIIAFAVLCAFVAVLGLIVLGLLRRVSLVLEEAESVLRARHPRGLGGLAPGTPIPEFEGVSRGGSRFVSSDLLGTRAVVVLLGSNCPACRMLEADLAASDLSDLGARAIAVVSDADHAERLARIADLEVVQQEDHAIAGAFQSNVTPHTFVVDSEGVIVSSGTPNTFDSLTRLASDVEGGGRTAETDSLVAS